MALATWWTSDRLMDLAPLSNFHVRLATDDAQLATHQSYYGGGSSATAAGRTSSVCGLYGRNGSDLWLGGDTRSLDRRAKSGIFRSPQTVATCGISQR